MPNEMSTNQALSRRSRPDIGFDRATGIRTDWEIVQAGIVFAIIGWANWRGAQALDYSWQWYQIEPYFLP